ncbi:silent information regulator protein Sir2 [Candidatus Poribacteria bacterium]|nr:silent information regulator protein Sir2 [Candidatus Poribacteria bacterium]
MKLYTSRNFLLILIIILASVLAVFQVKADMIIPNGGFESGNGEEIPEWNWWTREKDTGSAILINKSYHNGKQSALITHNGDRDFAFSNSKRLPVEFGQKLTATAWVKSSYAEEIRLAAVAMKGDKNVRWDIGSDGVWGTKDWTKLTALIKVPRNVDEIYLRFVGKGKVKAWVDDINLEKGWINYKLASKPKVTGYARERVEEKMDRGLIAVPLKDNKVYLSWRLLKDDPENTGFDVYRSVSDSKPEKINDNPITKTCDFIDHNPIHDTENRYFISTEKDKISKTAKVMPSSEGKNYISIPLQGDYTFQKVGIADLNGDGKYDYVIKQPNANVDPYVKYWKPSPSTYKVEAYLSNGTFLWRKDLGWGIEQGIWYSPMIVHDLDGDGKAEVCLKTGPEEDPRDEEGKVTSGPEYLSILNGITGEELAKADWPSRDGFLSYNYSSRNQICVAYLDGKTPCLIIERGTYINMYAVAYEFHNGKLRELWKWSSQEGGGLYRGQGAHSMHAVDVDNDDRDEVFLGSSVLDDNGVGLWSSGMGHPDHHYIGDIDPSHPGLEVYYGMERAQVSDGCWLADAATGERLWGLDESTKHVHASGMCSDIDANYQGMECYSGERDFPEQKWLWTSRGELIAKTDLGGLSPRTAYWDADLQRELIRGNRIYSYKGETHQAGIKGRLISVADILGDWREELIMSLSGEMRIYTTNIPASDRRICLMQDPLYRLDVAIQAMGYTQMPMTSKCFSVDKDK